MFCSHCGKPISDGARFCPNCGAQAQAQPPAPPAHESLVPTASSLNHDVLVSYLYQLRSMEFSKYKLAAMINTLDYQISRLGYYQNFQNSGSERQPSMIRGAFEGIMGGIFDEQSLGSVYVITLILLVLSSLISALHGLAMLALMGAIAYTLYVAYCGILTDQEECERQQEAYKNYLENVEADRKRVAAELVEKKRQQEERQNLYEKYQESDKILTEMYTINLIPQQFRNIYAIYYLYDYLSTSQSNLESAMLHFNLEEIKAKLDKVIAQQQEIILQQSIQIAQNDEMIAQNKKLIAHAIATEKNTRLAVQYHEIEAANLQSIAFSANVMSTIALKNELSQ